MCFDTVYIESLGLYYISHNNIKIRNSRAGDSAILYLEQFLHFFGVMISQLLIARKNDNMEPYMFSRLLCLIVCIFSKSRECCSLRRYSLRVTREKSDTMPDCMIFATGSLCLTCLNSSRKP